MYNLKKIVIKQLNIQNKSTVNVNYRVYKKRQRGSKTLATKKK